MKRIFTNVIKFWPVALLPLVCFLFLYFFSKLGTSDSFNVVLGISLGVMLGFLADISKRTFDDFQNGKILKSSALKLLEQDAKSIFRLFELFDGMIKSAKQSNAPKGIEHAIPPKLEMRYWEKLSQRDDFLLLAVEGPFERIFQQFWEFEKMNQLINSAQESDDEVQKKNARGLAYIISRQILQDKTHEDLLRLFLNQEELNIYKETYKQQT